MDDGTNPAPPVIGAEYVQEDTRAVETAYLPIDRADTDDDVELELRDTTDGSRALLAFTSLDQLVAGCGDGQLWIAVPGTNVPDIKTRSGSDVVLWDAALPLEDRRTRYQEETR